MKARIRWGAGKAELSLYRAPALPIDVHVDASRSSIREGHPAVDMHWAEYGNMAIAIDPPLRC